MTTPVVKDQSGATITATYEDHILTVNLKADETVYISGIPAETPQTGDNTSVAMWSTLAFSDLITCGAILVIDKKRKTEN